MMDTYTAWEDMTVDTIDHGTTGLLTQLHHGRQGQTIQEIYTDTLVLWITLRAEFILVVAMMAVTGQNVIIILLAATVLLKSGIYMNHILTKLPIPNHHSDALIIYSVM